MSTNNEKSYQEIASELRAMRQAEAVLKEVGLLYFNGEHWMFDADKLRLWKKHDRLKGDIIV